LAFRANESARSKPRRSPNCGVCRACAASCSNTSLKLRTTAAEDLAEFCAGLAWDALDDEVRQRTLELLLDLLGVALIGARQPSSLAARGAVLRLAGSGKANVVGTQQTASAVWAALANGTAAHAVELDDVTTESSLHPGVAVIPAAIALAQELQVPPKRLLEAIVAGYEVTMRVGNALNPASAYARGFHPTGVAGVFGATMAAAHLLELDTETRAVALGIAGTMASGSLEYLADGAWTKRLNAGWAGHAGITAATLAASGFSGPKSVFEGRLGVLHAYSDAALPDRLLADLGNPLQVMRVSIKPYACCRYNHGLIDCMLALRQRVDSLDEVERIRLGVLSGGALLVADPIEQKRAPVGIVDAQFSAPYAAAAALVFGAGDISVYEPSRLSDEGVRALMARTDCYRDASLDANYPKRWPAAAEIVLRSGEVLSARTEFAKGEPENPVSRDGLIAKFVSLADRADAEALARRILALDNAPDLAALSDALVQ
jgi:2-methylcitrate dehydratase PrpD